MSRAVKVAALGAVQSAYERFIDASEDLHKQIAAADAQQTTPPIQALQTDFDAQIDVTRAVINFAELCTGGGPSLDDLPGAAFVQALYQTAIEHPELEDELARLRREWAPWLAKVRTWTPNRGQPPPTRPSTAAHDRVLDVVDEFWGFLMDRTHDQIVESFAAQGHQVTETITTGPNGEVIQRADIALNRPEPSVPEPGRRSRRTWRGRRKRR